MSRSRTPARILDPVHGLISFADTPFDRLVLTLLDSRVMQRLRHIRQLGLISLVYPGATHSRFSHSLGAFHLARRMIEQFNRHIKAITQRDAEVTILAALLHDIGHGPFSHVFERAEPGGIQKHELMSIKLLSEPELVEIFADFERAEDLEVIGKLLSSANSPLSTIISGTFDADRLDYLQRDQRFTGSFQGQFDWPWLMDNLEWSDQTHHRGIVLGPRAVHAAEEYLLARSHLYQTVYFHRTARGAELMLSQLLQQFARLIEDGTLQDIAPECSQNNALRHWFSMRAEDRTIEDFLRLDDDQIHLLFSQLENCHDAKLLRLSQIKKRKLFHCYEPSSDEKHFWKLGLQKFREAELFSMGIMTEELTFSAYDTSQPIFVRDGQTCVELSELSAIARTLAEDQITVMRIYYDQEEDLQKFRKNIT